MEAFLVETLSPEENMERDYQAFLSVEEGTGKPPIVRLYKWNRLCLSLGHSQKDKPGLKLPLVKRPTGGGALLHGWDVSFSIADLKDRWGGKPSSIYGNIADIVKGVFEKLGTEVKQERFRGRYLDRFYCFWVPTLGELTYGGRKVVAMAMRTGRRAFILHGSVYVDFDYDEASRILGVDKAILKSRVISLREMGLREEEFLKTLSSRLFLQKKPLESPVSVIRGCMVSKRL